MKFCPECESEYTDALEFCPADGAQLVFVVKEETLVGQLLDDRFHVEAEIGAGGMGTVYRAVQEPIGRPVALKILRREHADDPGAVRRFFHEAKIVSKLRHPNTVTLFDFGQFGEGQLFIAMELMTGASLEQAARDRSLSLNEILGIGRQICQALGEAHGAGIVHRDLKPQNIFIDVVGGDSVVKVLDFGIAKMKDAKANLTLTGMVFGTPAYMSPQQAQGFEIDHRSDIYSLGVLLFELICGRLPFQGDQAVKVAMAHILQPVPSLAEHARYAPLPPGLSDLVEAMMAKEVEERPESAEAVDRALLALQSTEETSLSRLIPTPALDAVGSSGIYVAQDEPDATVEKNRTVVMSGDDIAEWERDRKRAKRRPLGLWLGAIALAAGATAFLAMGPMSGEDPDPTLEPERDLSAGEPDAGTEPDHEPAPQAVEADVGFAAALPVVRDGVGSALVAASSAQQAAVPGTVTVTFDVSPRDARVTRTDTDHVLCPRGSCDVELARSDTPIPIEVTRARRHTEQMRLVPNRDQTLSAELRRERSRSTESDDDDGEPAGLQLMQPVTLDP